MIENNDQKTRVTGIDNKVTGRDMHATRAGAGANLLGFNAGPADEDEGF